MRADSHPPQAQPAPTPGRLHDASPSSLVVFVWAALVGAATGALGAAFRIAVANVRSYTQRLPLWGEHVGPVPWLLPAVVTALLAWLAVLLVRRLAPEGGGSGVQEIEGALDGVRPLRWQRVIPVKFIGGLCSLGGGMVLGREGPTIQMGGAVGKMLADTLRLPEYAVRTLIAAGGGAGLTAAFNAPFAGVLFVIEEMRPQFEYTFTSVQSVVIACAVADVVVQAFTGQGPVLPVPVYAAPVLSALWLFPILGVAFGAIGVIFNRLLVVALDLFADLPGRLHWGAVACVGAVIGWLAWAYPNAVGGGEELVPYLLRSPVPAAALIALFVVRFGTTMLSYGCGAPGGIFAPILALGALFGMFYGHCTQAWWPEMTPTPGIFAIAGMGALFTASVRAPITGIALAVELTGDYAQILPLLLTCAAATIVAEVCGGRPIYSVLLKRTLEREKRDGRARVR